MSISYVAGYLFLMFFIFGMCRTPLILAVENDKGDVCDYLIEAGADVTLVDSTGSFTTYFFITIQRCNAIVLCVCWYK